MKTPLLAAIRCSLMFTAVTAFCVATPAKANTITTFNVSGTGERVATITGTTFGGTMTIDVTAGTLTAIDLSFQGVSPFNTINESVPFGTFSWRVSAGNGDMDLLTLLFATGHTPGSLVGFIGGFDFIFGLGVQDIGPHPRLLFDITSGSIFPSLTSPPVPDEGSSLTLLGIALPCLLGLVALRRKLPLLRGRKS
jgi:hypothetical protein